MRPNPSQKLTMRQDQRWCRGEMVLRSRLVVNINIVVCLVGEVLGEVPPSADSWQSLIDWASGLSFDCRPDPAQSPFCILSSGSLRDLMTIVSIATIEVLWISLLIRRGLLDYHYLPIMFPPTLSCRPCRTVELQEHTRYSPELYLRPVLTIIGSYSSSWFSTLLKFSNPLSPTHTSTLPHESIRSIQLFGIGSSRTIRTLFLIFWIKLAWPLPSADTRIVENKIKRQSHTDTNLSSSLRCHHQACWAFHSHPSGLAREDQGSWSSFEEPRRDEPPPV